MGIFCNCFKIDIFRKFHILGVDSEDLKSTNFIRHTNIDLPIKSTESSQSRVKRIRPVRCCDDNDVTSSLKSIHKSQQLRNNTSLDLAMNLFSIWGNRVYLINKDNCGTVFFCLFKCFSQISFRLSCHFGHNLRTIDEEKESSSLIRYSSCDQCFSRARGAIE